MRKKSLYQVLVLGMVAIVAAFALQGYYLLSAYQLKDQTFRQQVEVALMGVADGFAEINETLLPDVALINRVTDNYYVVNINDVIDAGELEYLLQRELEAVGLREDFEYGIYDCYTDRMVYGDLVSYEQTVDTTGRVALQTYDEYIYYFGVRFPNHRESIIASLGTVGALAAVIVITLIFFAYASWVLIRQQQLSEMQKDFINNMTHEFKTPLSTIKVASSVLARSPTVRMDPRLARYADIVESQNTRLTIQVEKVLQLARIERDHFSLEREPAGLDALLHEAAEGARAKVEAAGGTFELDLRAPERTVLADRLHLSGAISALLDNAVKYSPDTPKIGLRSHMLANGDVRVSVSDSGIGIPAEHRARVFDKFYRVPTGDVHDVKGFGLGLFYVAGVCHGHGYDIYVDDDAVVGTTFIIEIPARETGDGFWLRLRKRIFGPSNPPVWTQT